MMVARAKTRLYARLHEREVLREGERQPRRAASRGNAHWYDAASAQTVNNYFGDYDLTVARYVQSAPIVLR